MSLRQYAIDEMKRAGLYDEDCDYGAGTIATCVLELVETHAARGHSGGSHAMVLAVFNKVVNYQPLTPLTNDPSEWTEVGPSVWQSRRRASAFSKDGGATWYDLDEPGRPSHTSEVKP